MIAIIIVHYTGREDTLECLASVFAQTYPDTAIFLVDQGAGDGIPEIVRDAFPAVHVVENGENRGFAGGANAGIRAALAAGAAQVLLLNNDVTLAPDLLDRMLPYTERESTEGILGPLVLSADDPERIWATGG